MPLRRCLSIDASKQYLNEKEWRVIVMVFNERFKPLFEETEHVLIWNSGMPLLDPNFFLVTQFTSGVHEGSKILLTPEGWTLFTSRLEFDVAKRQVEDNGWADHVEIVTFSGKKEFEESFKRKMSEWGVDTLGINGNLLPWKVVTELKDKYGVQKFVDVSEKWMDIRLIKTPEEIAKIRKACEIASKVAEEIPAMEMNTELGLAAQIEFSMKMHGANRASFDTIVATGPNAADPHHGTSEKRIRANEFLLIDFGALYQNYCSDVTRTFFLGKSSAKDTRMYETVLRAQEAALEMIQPGVKGKDVDKAARDVIDAHPEYKGTFIHSLGHGLGLLVHDGGALSPHEEDFTLKEGMVLTVEPGIYIQGHGGVRIEDDIVVTKDGYELLTPAPKAELININI